MRLTFNPDQAIISRKTVICFFLALLSISFLLRIFYSGNLYEDDGLWFTAAEEILRGKALYGEIYFDKPPALPLIYAALFKLFGAHIIVIRLFTVLYAVAIGAALYRFGSLLYDRRMGLIAAACFVIFSTTYTTGHMQGLNTDFLMALPYAAAAFLFVRSRAETIASRSRWLALSGGALAGIASQINPKAIFALIFFVALLIAARFFQKNEATEYGSVGVRECGSMGASEYGNDKTSSFTPTLPHPHTPTPLHLFTSSPLHLFTLAIVGFIMASLPFLIYIAASGSLSDYWTDVWVWGSRYAGYFSLTSMLVTALSQTAGYFALNSTLLVALVVVTFRVIRRRKTSETEQASDVMMLLWLAVSYAGLCVGGRFYGHYFFQILPPLCLIAARGLRIIREALRSDDIALRVRRSAIAFLMIGFVFTLARFHIRTVELALDWIRGKKSQTTVDWYHEKLSREERMIAALVRRLPDGAGDRAEEIRAGGPREKGINGPEDYLFVWGYRPEVYYWSGLIPASRFLSTQSLTGIPADVHYFHDKIAPILDDEAMAHARKRLLDDLEQTQPKYLIDELGVFNRRLAMKSFPEFQEFLSRYKRLRRVERFIVYIRKDMRKKGRKKMRREKRAAEAQTRLR
ncbi:MAG: glycosyltransferase family 39 protein [Acidobacteriota bacterium]